MISLPWIVSPLERPLGVVPPEVTPTPSSCPEALSSVLGPVEIATFEVVASEVVVFARNIPIVITPVRIVGARLSPVEVISGMT